MAPAAVCVVSAVSLVAVFPWAVVKLGWGFGATLLGVSAEEWRRGADLTPMSAPARALSGLGVDITVVAAAIAMIAAVVLLARLPRWLPAPLLIIPSALAAIPLAGYGYPLLIGGLLGLGGVVRVAPDPILPGLDLPLIMIFGGLAFAGIGTALAVGAGALFRRSRPVCRPGTYDEAPRVAVIGAGFAGQAAVKELAKEGSRDADRPAPVQHLPAAALSGRHRWPERRRRHLLAALLRGPPARGPVPSGDR